jgi:hypothetical protein
MNQRLDEVEMGGNGHQEKALVEGESQDQLNTAHKRLVDLIGKGQDGSLVSLGKQELSLLQKILSTGSEEYREQQLWRMCSFMDEEEALDHVAAFYEAKELGMDTGFNVAYAFALCSANRKNAFSGNLVAVLGDILQHGKWAAAPQGKKNNGYQNPRSPISA